LEVSQEVIHRKTAEKREKLLHLPIRKRETNRHSGNGGDGSSGEYQLLLQMDAILSFK
jgi:hypothetical protein